MKLSQSLEPAYKALSGTTPHQMSILNHFNTAGKQHLGALKMSGWMMEEASDKHHN